MSINFSFRNHLIRLWKNPELFSRIYLRNYLFIEIRSFSDVNRDNFPTFFPIIFPYQMLLIFYSNLCEECHGEFRPHKSRNQAWIIPRKVTKSFALKVTHTLNFAKSFTTSKVFQALKPLDINHIHLFQWSKGVFVSSSWDLSIRQKFMRINNIKIFFVLWPGLTIYGISPLAISVDFISLWETKKRWKKEIVKWVIFHLYMYISTILIGKVSFPRNQITIYL